MAKKTLSQTIGDAVVVAGTVAYVGDATVDAMKKSTPVRNGLVKAVDEKAANIIDEFILGKDEAQKKAGRRLPDVDIQQGSSSEYQMGC